MKGLHTEEALGNLRDSVGSYDKLESYQGEESPQHNETVYSEAPAQVWWFQSDRTLPPQSDNADLAAVHCSCFVTMMKSLH